MAELALLSMVALMEDVPEKGLVRGQVGTIVKRLESGVYEIDFSDDNGQTYASAALPADLLMPLYHEPEHYITRTTEQLERACELLSFWGCRIPK